MLIKGRCGSKMTRVSIIAPNLNEAKYLQQFLKSVEAQTFKDWELIVVDGGSTDGSLEILNGFGKAKVLIDMTRNIGYIRNVGAKLASGDVLFHTSSDVYLEPNLLEKIVRYYEQHQDCVALTGRTFPCGTSIFAHLSYQAFDLLRWFFAKFGFPSKKFRPSGNFFTVKQKF
jgi:glycosyltransferase involved in cell wall biosynthesis